VVAYDDFGREVLRFNAFDPSFNGGVRVSRADVNGDGQTDLIAAAGPGGGPHVKVFDGATGALVREFFAYDANFSGGVFVDGADLNGDGRAEIVTGAGAGGAPHVKVFDGLSGGQVASFFAYGASFTGGVSVAAGRIGGALIDGNWVGGLGPVIATGAGPGGGPHVKIFSPTGVLIDQLFAYDARFTGGVNVAISDAASDGFGGALLTGAGPGGGAHVRTFVTGNPLALLPAPPASAFLFLVNERFAFEPGYRGGVEVGSVTLGTPSFGVLHPEVAILPQVVTTYTFAGRMTGGTVEVNSFGSPQTLTPFGTDFLEGVFLD
jgi:FG-GAP-like repeat